MHVKNNQIEKKKKEQPDLFHPRDLGHFRVYWYEISRERENLFTLGSIGMRSLGKETGFSDQRGVTLGMEATGWE